MGADSEKRMKLRFAGTCRLCETPLPVDVEAIYERNTKTVRCLECAPAASPASGIAGTSARREYDRRKAKRDEDIRTKHPKLGGLILAVIDEPQSTRAWERGAVGEELLGARLDGLAAHGIAVLHDRRIPRTRANIDHIAVTSAGVWVIDAKRYKGRPELRVEGGFLRPRVERLVVADRDCTKLVDGVLKQVELVRAVVGDVPVTGALCFVDADWPLIGGAFITRKVHTLWPKRLAKVLAEAPPGAVDVSATQSLLAKAFPAA